MESMVSAVQINTRWERTCSAYTDSRKLEAVLERVVFANVQYPVPSGFTVTNILNYCSLRTEIPANRLEVKLAGLDSYLIIFPERLRRRLFVREHDRVQIGGCRVHFIKWSASFVYETCRYEKLVWLRVFNLPFHHYTRSAAEAIASRFGKLSAVHLEKSSFDFSSLDMLVKCSDVIRIPRQLSISYHELHRREIVLLVDLEMPILDFDKLGYSMCGLPYDEIFKLALEGTKVEPIGLDRLSLN